MADIAGTLFAWTMGCFICSRLCVTNDGRFIAVTETRRWVRWVFWLAFFGLPVWGAFHG